MTVPPIVADAAFEEWKKRPLALVLTAALLILFALDLAGKIKIDGWAMLTFMLAIIPWAFPAIIFALRSFGSAFSETNLTSFQIGTLKIERLEQKVDEQSRKINEQRKVLDDLAIYSMAYYIYDKLKYLHLGTIPAVAGKYGEYRYRRDEAFDHDLRYLRDHGYLEMFQISDLSEGENLVGRLRATEMGRRFVELKEARFAEIR